MNVSRLESCIELPLLKEELKEIVDKAKDWALMHGNILSLKYNHCTCNKQIRDTYYVFVTCIKSFDLFDFIYLDIKSL